MLRNRLVMVALVGVGAIGLCRAAEDAGPDVAPDWSKYEVVGSAVGEVVKVDAKGLTLRVTWYVPDIEKKKANKGARRNKNRARGKRPAIGKNQNFRNPFAPSRRPGFKVTVREEHHDYEMRFVEQSLVRFKVLPPRFDSNGDKMPYTIQEKDALGKPVGVPGYRASRGDLARGTIVDVDVVRPREGKDDDLVVRHAVILGRNPNPAPDGKRKKP